MPTQVKPASQQRVALILAGCGAKDGSEITESVSLMIALSQANFAVSLFAPNRPTAQTINHWTNNEEGPARNILTEAARIGRGKVLFLEQLNVDDFDALVFAGGFGAAKNLCNYAFAGVEATLFPDIKEALLPFLFASKPVAALCIAPVIIALGAREAGIQGIKITLGDGSAQDAISAVESWGATHVPTSINAACIDKAHRIVTSPAYMYDDATPADIFASASALVAGLRDVLN